MVLFVLLTGLQALLEHTPQLQKLSVPDACPLGGELHTNAIFRPFLLSPHHYMATSCMVTL